jgi:hypothetical protein
MTIYEGDSNVWEEGMEEKEKIVLSDYETKVRLKIISTRHDICLILMPILTLFSEM